MKSTGDNRAVSALFRVAGGSERLAEGDAREICGWRGAHRVEWVFLAVLVPLTLMAALAEWIGWLPAIPATFLANNFVPLVLMGKDLGGQWRRWLCLLTIWGIWRMDSGGFTGFLAWAWITIFVLNTAAAVLLGIKFSMVWKGGAGVIWRMFLLILPHSVAFAAGWKWGWQWAILGGAGIASVYCLCVLRPGCQWLGPVRRTNDGGEILVTIDDGPDPVDTPVLLDLLERYQVKAVFFLIGRKVEAYPELAREVLRRGHEIGNHTMDHPQTTFWCAGPWRTRREITECQRVIEKITGVKPRWFRAPAGHRNLFTHPVAADLGLEVIGWSRRGYDTLQRDPAKVLESILTKLVAGDIVLVHEATPIAEAVLRGVLERVTRR